MAEYSTLQNSAQLNESELAERLRQFADDIENGDVFVNGIDTGEKTRDNTSTKHELILKYTVAEDGSRVKIPYEGYE